MIQNDHKHNKTVWETVVNQEVLAVQQDFERYYCNMMILLLWCLIKTAD